MTKRSKKVDSNGPQIKKTFHVKDLLNIQPLKPAQEKLFSLWNKNSDTSLFLYGSAGTGKTFCAMYLALSKVLDPSSEYDNLIIVRSTVPSRDMGFLPGDLDEKIQVYEEPYIGICNELFEYSNSYDSMKKKGIVKFLPTAFLRGTTFDNTIILVDESQNMTYQELDTIITRVGRHSKVIFSGDLRQTDLLSKRNDVSGFVDFKKIVNKMSYFKSVEFKPEDIVRSGLVKEYLLLKEEFLD